MKRRAAIVSFGIVSKRLSSVTVPMVTIVLSLWASAVFLEAAMATMRLMEMGGRLILDMKRRRRMTRLNAESVRPVV